MNERKLSGSRFTPGYDWNEGESGGSGALCPRIDHSPRQAIYPSVGLIKNFSPVALR
jgi:hypothetical protein